nr:hypothetical protein [Sphingobium sp. YR768]
MTTMSLPGGGAAMIAKLLAMEKIISQNQCAWPTRDMISTDNERFR